MKRTVVSLLPFLVLAAGCAVGIEEDGTPLPEDTTEQTQELDGTEVQAEPVYPPSLPGFEAPDLSGNSTELEEGSRPDPGPWLNDDDPQRPDPGPWSPSTEPKSSSGSSGAND